MADKERPVYAQRLAALRKERGLSQYDLARDLGRSRGLIGNYEQGTREPDYETLGILAGYFGVPADYILGLSDVRELPTEEELLAQLPPDIKSSFRGRNWHDLDPETRRHIAWAISMDLERLKEKAERKEEESENPRKE